MRLSGQVPHSLDQWLALDTALDDAFAPLRARTVNIGPARVRAAVRWAAAEPSRLGGFALLTRASELAFAAAISAFVLGGSLTSVAAVPTVPDLSRDATMSATRVLNGRLAFQPPIDARAIEDRMTVGDVAANAASARRTKVALVAYPVRDTEPFAAKQ